MNALTRDMIVQSDAVAWLKTLLPDSVDLVITDPAYESLEKHRAKGSTTRLKESDGSSNPWFEIFPNERFGDLFRELYRVMKPGSHLYMLVDSETMFHVKPIGEAHGFRFWRPLVWDKVRIGMGYHYRGRAEYILFFEKGKRKLNNLSISDVLTIDPADFEEDVIRTPRVLGKYPTEKPVPLLEILVQQSSAPGELVVDPFAGSGSTGVAALIHGRRFAGCDLAARAVEISNRRCEVARG